MKFFLFGVLSFFTPGVSSQGWGFFGGGPLSWRNILGQSRTASGSDSDTTVTCTFNYPGVISGGVTFKTRRQAVGWRLLSSRSEVVGKIALKSAVVDGDYNIVVTENSRAGSGCTHEGLGHIMRGGSSSSSARANPLGNMFSNSFGNVFGGSMYSWGSPWMSPWGQGGSLWGVGMGSSSGSVITRAARVTLEANQEIVDDLAPEQLPYQRLSDFAGRSLALCENLMEEIDGSQACMDPVLACCTLGYDNQDAVVPE